MKDETNKVQNENTSDTTPTGGLATNYSQEYISPTPGEIPLVAYGVIPANLYSRLSKDGTIKENYDLYKIPVDNAVKSVRECGFNCVVIWGGVDHASPLMERCIEAKYTEDRKCNLPTIFLLNPDFCESYANTKNMVKGFEGKEYPRMYIVQDEPLYYDWGQVIFGIEYSDAVNKNPDMSNINISTYQWNKLIKTYSYLVERGGYCYKKENDGNGNSVLVKDAKRLSYFNLGCSHDSYDAKRLDEGGWVNSDKLEFWSPFSAFSKDTPQYLDAMQIMFQPSVWSYDLYPFRFEKTVLSTPIIPAPENEWKDVPGIKELSFDFKHRQFFYQLEKFGERSRLDNRPFFAYCMTASLGGWNADLGKFESYFPTPTLGMLRYSAFNALASGAQGLVFFTYAQGWGTDSESSGTHPDLFYDAPLTAKMPAKDLSIIEDKAEREKEAAGIIYGYKNHKLWQIVHSVLTDIRSVQDIFLDAQMVRLGHYGGDADEYEGLTQVRFPFGAITGMDTGSEGVFMSWLVSRSSDRAGDYIVIVNHDPFKVQLRVRVWYSNSFRLETVYASKSALESVEVSPEESTGEEDSQGRENCESRALGEVCTYIDLQPGGMHIFRVNPRVEAAES